MTVCLSCLLYQFLNDCFLCVVLQLTTGRQREAFSLRHRFTGVWSWMEPVMIEDFFKELHRGGAWLKGIISAALTRLDQAVSSEPAGKSSEWCHVPRPGRWQRSESPSPPKPDLSPTMTTLWTGDQAGQRAHSGWRKQLHWEPRGPATALTAGQLRTTTQPQRCCAGAPRSYHSTEEKSHSRPTSYRFSWQQASTAGRLRDGSPGHAHLGQRQGASGIDEPTTSWAGELARARGTPVILWPEGADNARNKLGGATPPSMTTTRGACASGFLGCWSTFASMQICQYNAVRLLACSRFLVLQSVSLHAKKNLLHSAEVGTTVLLATGSLFKVLPWCSLPCNFQTLNSQTASLANSQSNLPHPTLSK